MGVLLEEHCQGYDILWRMAPGDCYCLQLQHQMNERIIEIILYLITRLQENQDIKQSDLLQLSDGGYSDAEIGAAFSWIARKDGGTPPSIIGRSGFRVLHQAERHLFTREAWGYLMQLTSLSVISGSELEEIIDQARMIGAERLTLFDVRRMAANLMMDSEEPNTIGRQLARQTVESVH